MFVGIASIISYLFNSAKLDWSLESMNYQASDGLVFDPDEIRKHLFWASLSWVIPFNCFFTFGEELGWRGFLYKHLQETGVQHPIAKTNIVWGIWHMPLIIMGLNYPGYPFLGVVFMIIFTLLFGRILCWIQEKGESIFPVVIAHAALNAQGHGLFPKIFPTDNPLLGGALGIPGLMFLVVLNFILESISPLKKISLVNKGEFSRWN